MKKIVIAVLALMMAATSSQAQNLKSMAERIKNNAKENTENKIENKANQTIDNAVDKTFDCM